MIEETTPTIQEALQLAITDPIGDALEDLDVSTCLKLIRAHATNDIRRFMQNHYAPTRSPKEADVRRAMAVLRRDRPDLRLRAVTWLTSRLSPRVHRALVQAVGPPEAAAGHPEVDLSELIEEFGAPAIQLAVLSLWGTEFCDLNLSMLIVDGRAVPERWRPHLDQLSPIAEEVVRDFAELDDDTDEEEPLSNDDDLDEVVPDEPTGEGGGGSLFADAQGDAIAALEVWEESGRAFERAMESVRRLATGPAGRFVHVESTTDSASPEDLDSLRLFALKVLRGGADPNNVQFLEALAELCDLHAGDAMDTDLMAAEEKVRALPAAAMFRSVVYAAGHGRLRIGSRQVAVDTRLEPWLDAAPGVTTEGAEDAPESEEPGGAAGSDGGSSTVAPVLEVAPEASVANETQAPALEDLAPSPDAPVVDSQETEQEPDPVLASSVAEEVIETLVDAEEAEEAGSAICYAEMFRASRWSLARWLALAEGDLSRAQALEAVAYADGARSASGHLALELANVVGALDPHELGSDRPMQVVAVAAAVRAAVVAPYSGVAPVLSAAARTFDADAPDLAALADAASQCATRGISLSGDLLGQLGGASAAEELIAGVVAEADAMLTRTGRTGFVRADHIWSDWVVEGGPIHELLSAVAADDAERISSVREAVFEYAKESVQGQRLREYDDRYRGSGKPRVEGAARVTLLGRLREAVRIAPSWLDSRAALAMAGGNHQMAAVTRLQDALRRHRGGVDAYLTDLVEHGTVELVGAAEGAKRILEVTFALIEGRGLPGGEADPSVLLDADLLLTPIALGADLGPTDVAAVTPADVVVALERSWNDAFDVRSVAGDHVATAAIVAVVGATDPVRGTELADRRAVALEAARDAAQERARDLEGLLESARRSGRLNEDGAGELVVLLERANDPGRIDLDVVDSELTAIAERLASEGDAAVEAFRARLAQESEDNAAVAAEAERFEQLLDERDLATAEEILLQILEGQDQAVAHIPDVDFEEFFPAIVDFLRDGIDQSLIDVAAERSVAGPLDFSGLSVEAASGAAAALEAWRTVAGGERQVHKANALAPALRALGLEFKGEKSTTLPGSNDRAWIDVTGVERVPQMLVPAFGSDAGSEQRLLLVWKQPGESLLQWIEQDPSERPVIVLYFGTMSAELRVRIANELRSGPPRPVAIVDDAVVAWAASLGRQTFEVTMRATLPFSAVNPYLPTVAGAVPEEMFYGRAEERAAVINPLNTSLIYGGRRLGKSALLRASARRFDDVPGQRAIYIDISAAVAGARERPEAVWDLILTQLIWRGIAERPTGRRVAGDPYDGAVAAIQAYLATSDIRRLLLLLDECDDFFDADAKTDFVQTRRLKELMESSDRRFKVVFAGLHQVARFASYPNQPLAHLGRPLPIGPLSAQPAHNLIAKPLLALGWRFASEDLINRVLAYCNYTPILLQEFGHTLIEHLHRRPATLGQIPETITGDDIDAVLGSGRLREAIRYRFTLTLSLDPRYKMIAYVLALEALGTERAFSTALTSSDLLQRCRGWWPDGFAGVNSDEFRALLDELVGLGVLASDRGTWRMRSPNVLRLLGSRGQIEDELVELVAENPTPGGLFSADAHRLVESPSGDERVRSPLTEQQLNDVIGEGHNRLRIVVGSAATCAEMVGPVLKACHKLMGDRWDERFPNRRAVFEREVSEGLPRRHRLVFSDIRGAAEDSLLRSVEVCAKHPTQPGATCAVVLVISPTMVPFAERALESIGHEDAAIVPLRRYSTAGLMAWTIEVESAHANDATRRRLHDVTGGWPVLVEEVGADAASVGLGRALDHMEESLVRRSERLLEEIGVAEPPLSDAWAVTADLLDDGTGESIDFLGPIVGDDGEAIIRALEAAGVLDEDDGVLKPEPISAAARRAIGG